MGHAWVGHAWVAAAELSPTHFLAYLLPSVLAQLPLGQSCNKGTGLSLLSTWRDYKQHSERHKAGMIPEHQGPIAHKRNIHDSQCRAVMPPEPGLAACQHQLPQSLEPPSSLQGPSTQHWAAWAFARAGTSERGRESSAMENPVWAAYNWADVVAPERQLGNTAIRGGIFPLPLPAS